jgi:dCTP deaminase
MILMGNEIKKGVKNGDIFVEPFLEENVAINSIDVRLSKFLITYIPLKIEKTINNKNIVKKDLEKMRKMETYLGDEYKDVYISMRKDNPIFELEIPEEGLIITPDILFLGSTIEKAGSDKYIPMYEGRSSMGRLGIESHISAGFGDLGFKSNWTLEITVVHPLEIFSETRIGQVYFIKGEEEEVKIAMENGFSYKGKYTDQPKPQSSKSYKDYENK